MVDDNKFLVDKFCSQFPKLFSTSVSPKIGQINADIWKIILDQSSHVVASLSREQKEGVIRDSGRIVKHMPYSYFQVKQTRRPDDVIKRAIQKINLEGEGWFSFGLTSYLSWDAMIKLVKEETINKIEQINEELNNYPSSTAIIKNQNPTQMQTIRDR